MARTPRRATISRFFNPRSITALSIRDLLEARDAHHVHLANLPNVVGTAIGLYRIRANDRDAGDGSAEWKRKGAASPRTLLNSVIRPWSLPCVLVFVETWSRLEGLRDRPDDVVPSWIYLPDGRRAPVCVIHAPHQERPAYEPRVLAFPTGLAGGSYPVITNEQGTQRVGTIACLVSDDRGVYALTNRHVVGQPGTVAYTLERGELKRIGVASDHSVGKQRLEEVYPGWSARRTLVNVDAGLFRIDDLSVWTSQIYGLGRLGQPIDLSVDTMSLGLIGCPVRGFGGVSGEMRGCVHALFYRYRTVGGTSYVADFVIGPREDQQRVETQPGDSGTLWVYDEADDLDHDEFRAARGSGRFGPIADKDHPGAAVKTPLMRPLAMQWGGHSVLVPGSDDESRFVLATTISNVCRLLDVELVRDWAIEHSEYWGKVGHYKIGYSACLRPYHNFPRLRALLRANAENIAVSDDDIKHGQMPKANQDAFVALADVPDLLWRSSRKKDQANHFADMDQPAPAGEHAGKSLMQLWRKPELRTPQVWEAFYSSFTPPPKVQHRGALPFRVRQLFNEMVEALSNGELDHYVCVAGVLAHYVGDACQPLHVSHLHHGSDPDEEKVHSVYETGMLDSFSTEFINLLNTKLAGADSKPLIKSGDAAANLTVELMRKTIKRLPPQHVIDVFNEIRGRGQTANMWAKLKTDTVAVTADGVLTLSCLWSSAWALAKGESKFSKTQAGKKIKPEDLAALYNNVNIAPANWLRDMG